MSDSSLYIPQYCSLEEVKLELRNKVFYENNRGNSVSDNEVLDNIEDAESEIELLLSRQYIVPFIGVDKSKNLIPFNQIQPKSTIKAIGKMCLLQSCILIMQTVFGRKEGIRGQPFLDNYQAELERWIRRMVGIDEKSGQYLYPPMLGLAVNDAAAYFKAGIEMPKVAMVGATSNSYGNQVLDRTINGVSNWMMRGWPFVNPRR